METGVPKLIPIDLYDIQRVSFAHFLYIAVFILLPMFFILHLKDLQS